MAVALNATKTRLLPRTANITRFRQRLVQLFNLNIELSSPADIDFAAESFLRNINLAGEYFMLGQLPCSPPSPALVRHKRALRRQYMRSRNPLDLRDFRRAAHEL
ncbi:GH22325 [Drosophila grimshawi]|uniref:GH22325 n=1 Tax=Drosophila grimshawi TaxID=7222 RepID=B4JYW5_DROGR|nr:GH22325 [Drosophila grimshawi]